MGPVRAGLLALTVGAWLGVTAATWAAPVMAFSVAHAVPGEDEAMADAAHRQAAAFNGLMFAGSSRVQLALAGVALALAAWPPRASKGAVVTLGLAAVLATALALVVVPRANAIAQRLASGEAEATEADAAAMRVSHAAYGALDLAKLALLAAGVTLALRAARRPA